MQHVDDGTIHAWLDDQIADAGEAARIEEHLRGCAACSARVAGERETFDRAQALLAATAPAGDRTSFEDLVAKAGLATRGAEAPMAGRAAGNPRRGLLIKAGWAASLALAVGLGWTARELTGGGALDSDPAAPAAQQSASAEIPTSLRPDIAPQTSAPGSRGGAAVAPGRDAGAGPVATTPPRAANTASPAPPRRTAEQRAEAAPTPGGATAPVEAVIPGEVQSAQVAQAAAPPALPPPIASLRQPLRSESQPGAALMERVAITGAAPAAVRADSGWIVMPRTEAAVRTRMPLYGIAGLEAVVTSVSADGLLVQTLYRLPTGETMELVQQRADSAAVNPTGVEATGRARGAAARGGIVADQTAVAPRTWSAVRDDVRLTLQTTSLTADLESLAKQLQVD